VSPLCPQKQTLKLSRVMSALCQKQTYAAQQNALFEHLVRGREQRLQDDQASR